MPWTRRTRTQLGRARQTRFCCRRRKIDPGGRCSSRRRQALTGRPTRHTPPPGRSPPPRPHCSRTRPDTAPRRRRPQRRRSPRGRAPRTRLWRRAGSKRWACGWWGVTATHTRHAHPPRTRTLLCKSRCTRRQSRRCPPGTGARSGTACLSDKCTRACCTVPAKMCPRRTRTPRRRRSLLNPPRPGSSSQRSQCSSPRRRHPLRTCCPPDTACTRWCRPRQIGSGAAAPATRRRSYYMRCPRTRTCIPRGFR